MPATGAKPRKRRLVNSVTGRGLGTGLDKASFIAIERPRRAPIRARPSELSQREGRGKA
jgi:hypothetical protein